MWGYLVRKPPDSYYIRLNRPSQSLFGRRGLRPRGASSVCATSDALAGPLQTTPAGPSGFVCAARTLAPAHHFAIRASRPRPLPTSNFKHQTSHFLPLALFRTVPGGAGRTGGRRRGLRHRSRRRRRKTLRLYRKGGPGGSWTTAWAPSSSDEEGRFSCPSGREPRNVVTHAYDPLQSTNTRFPRWI